MTESAGTGDGPRRDWPPLDAPKASCLYPWCTRRLKFRTEGSGRQPLFCGRAHRDLYGRERRSLERQLAAARAGGQSTAISMLEWKLLRYPTLRVPPGSDGS
ncbi:hypothetical protein [Blastococcus sp. KM273129]|uniref:hypothetical protein n=1 Tax=Blastococcus sp. KM273129 TaxID=2570315 RepID=UPI001F442B52|nr:hypothetical protein [Blastococcus sp. KM273129]MCF6733636.1 hypothetical protein [Blastococcus sp. KM273129]